MGGKTSNKGDKAEQPKMTWLSAAFTIFGCTVGGGILTQPALLKASEMGVGFGCFIVFIGAILSALSQYYIMKCVIVAEEERKEKGDFGPIKGVGSMMAYTCQKSKNPMFNKLSQKTVETMINLVVTAYIFLGPCCVYCGFWSDFVSKILRWNEIGEGTVIQDSPKGFAQKTLFPSWVQAFGEADLNAKSWFDADLSKLWDWDTLTSAHLFGDWNAKDPTTLDWLNFWEPMDLNSELHPIARIGVFILFVASTSFFKSGAEMGPLPTFALITFCALSTFTIANYFMIATTTMPEGWQLYPKEMFEVIGIAFSGGDTERGITFVDGFKAMFTIFNCAGNIVFAYLCHTVCVDIVLELEDTSDSGLQKACFGNVVLSFVVMILVTLCGYMTLGENAEIPYVNNYDPSILLQIVLLMMCLNLLLVSLPGNIMPMRNAIFDVIYPQKEEGADEEITSSMTSEEDSDDDSSSSEDEEESAFNKKKSSKKNKKAASFEPGYAERVKFSLVAIGLAIGIPWACPPAFGLALGIVGGVLGPVVLFIWPAMMIASFIETNKKYATTGATITKNVFYFSCFLMWAIWIAGQAGFMYKEQELPFHVKPFAANFDDAIVPVWAKKIQKLKDSADAKDKAKAEKFEERIERWSALHQVIQFATEEMPLKQSDVETKGSVLYKDIKTHYLALMAKKHMENGDGRDSTKVFSLGENNKGREWVTTKMKEKTVTQSVPADTPNMGPAIQHTMDWVVNRELTIQRAKDGNANVKLILNRPAAGHVASQSQTTRRRWRRDDPEKNKCRDN